MTNPAIAAVRTALTALDQALDAGERQAAERALLTAGAELDLKVQERFAWLMVADAWMDANEDTLDADEKRRREDRYIVKLREYEDMVNALADATGVIRLPIPVKRALPAQPVLSQGGLL